MITLLFTDGLAVITKYEDSLHTSSYMLSRIAENYNVKKYILVEKNKNLSFSRGNLVRAKI